MIPGRMVLLITLLLMLTNIFTSVTSQSPTTKSLTSISTWILTCILFVYGALMEYGCILGLLTYLSLSKTAAFCWYLYLKKIQHTFFSLHTRDMQFTTRKCQKNYQPFGFYMSVFHYNNFYCIQSNILEYSIYSLKKGFCICHTPNNFGACV